MKQRQLRRTRVADDDDAPGEAAAATGTQAAQQQQPSGAPAAPKPAAAATAAAPAAAAAARSGAPASALNRPSSKAALLSFGGGDEEGEEDGPLAMAGKPRKDRKERKPKITRPQGLPDLPTGPSSTQRSAAGEYSTERLKELQRNALSYSATKLGGPSEGGAGAGEEPLIKLSGTFKARSGNEDGRYSLPSSVAVVQPVVRPIPLPDQGQEQAGSVEETKDKAGGVDKGKEQAAAAAPEEDEDEEGFIPDKETIRLAKMKRERLRHAHLAPDYIPMHAITRGVAGRGGRGAGSVATAAEEGEGEGAGSDGSGSGDEPEEAMRLKFGTGLAAKAGAAAGAGARGARGRATGRGGGGGGPEGAEGGAGAEGEEGQEDEEESFAQAQLRKAIRRSVAAMPGVGGAAASGAAAAAGAAGGAGPGAYDFYAPPSGAAAAAAIGAWAASGAGAGALLLGGAASQAALGAAAASSLTALQQGLERLRTSHSHTQTQLQRTQGNLDNALQAIERHERESKAAGERYVYMQKIRAYIADLCDCLSHKSPLIEELEEDLQTLREDRAEAVRDADEAIEKELLIPAEAAASAALNVLARGGAPAAAAAAAREAVEEAEDRLLFGEGRRGREEEVDEFGRSVEIERDREREARAGIRARLIERELATARQLPSAADPCTLLLSDDPDPSASTADPMSDNGAASGSGRAGLGHGGGGSANHRAGAGASTGEEDPEVSAARRYAVRHKDILDTAATVFLDVGDEFAKVEAVRDALQEFKSRYPKDYRNAYMHLSNPALFAPYVRLELLRWDPLFADSPSPGAAPASATPSTLSASTPPTSTPGLGAGAGTGSEVAGGAGAGAGADTPAPAARFDSLHWYEALFDFGQDPDATEAVADDPDADLVPALVRQLVLPVSLHLLKRCWRPGHLGQTRAAAALLAELFVYVPSDEPWEELRDVMKSVMDALEEAVAAIVIPAWPAAVAAVSPVTEAVQFRRFRRAVRLMRCLACWEGVVSRPLLVAMAVGRLAVGQCLPYLRGALAAAGAGDVYQLAVARLEAVALALPAVWFEGGTPQEATALMDHVAALMRYMESQRGDKGRAPLAARLARIALHLGDAERGGRLAAAFGLRM